MKALMLSIIFFASSALANDDRVLNKGNGTQTVQICNQAKVKECKPKVIYMTYKQQDRIRALEAELAKLKKENEELNNQVSVLSYAVHHKKPEKVIKYKYKYKKVDPDLNSFSLMLPYSPTGLDVDDKGGNDYNAETVYEVGLGLMYQRDFLDDDEGDSSTRLSIGATTLGTVQVGLGLTW